MTKSNARHRAEAHETPSRMTGRLRCCSPAAAALIGIAVSLPAIAQTGTVTGRNATVVRPSDSTPTMASFQISRSGSTAFAQSVAYQTADGTGAGGTNIAIAGRDYVASSGTATFAVGQAVSNILIPVLADPAANSRVQFLLRLSAGQGAANLAPQQFVSTRLTDDGTAPTAVVSADVNGDGRADLIVANSSLNQVVVLRNTTANGVGSVSYAAPVAYATGLNPGSLAVADIDGDGRPDIVVANRDSGTVSILRNTGTGSGVGFAPQAAYATGGSGPSSVAVADLNGDGRADIVVANQTTNTVAFLPQDSTGITFSTVQIAGNGASPRSVVLADVNGDGRSDILVAYHDDNTVGVISTATGDSVVTFTQTVLASGTGPNAVAAADLDGDGSPDIVVAEGNDNSVSVMRNLGTTTPSFGPRQRLNGPDFPIAVTAADIDGDGRADLLAANAGNSTLTLLLNTSSGAGSLGFASPLSFATGANPSAVTVSDVNRDGRTDVVVANQSSSSVSVLVNAPGVVVSTFAANGLPGVIEPNPATTTPNPFGFTTIQNATPNTNVISNSIVISGNTATAPVSVTGHGARFSIDGGPWLSSGGTLNSGQSVRVQLRTDAGSSVTTTITLIVGSTSGTFSVVNRP